MSEPLRVSVVSLGRIGSSEDLLSYRNDGNSDLTLIDCEGYDTAALQRIVSDAGSRVSGADKNCLGLKVGVGDLERLDDGLIGGLGYIFVADLVLSVEMLSMIARFKLSRAVEYDVALVGMLERFDSLGGLTVLSESCLFDGFVVGFYDLCRDFGLAYPNDWPVVDSILRSKLRCVGSSRLRIGVTGPNLDARLYE